jgi:DHA1 family bicyclomycin/chloramphenicol resistance-like MFS transporter
MPSFPAVAADLGVHIVNLQLTLSSFMLGTAFGQILYGPINLINFLILAAIKTSS